MIATNDDDEEWLKYTMSDTRAEIQPDRWATDI